MIGLFDEAVDGGLEIDDDLKTPRLRQRRLSLTKKPSTALSHDAEVGVKWKTKDGGPPIASLRVLVGGVVVEDEGDDLPDRHLGLDGIEEADELLMIATVPNPPAVRSKCYMNVLAAVKAPAYPAGSAIASASMLWTAGEAGLSGHKRALA